jgi:hypothetical protein
MPSVKEVQAEVMWSPEWWQNVFAGVYHSWRTREDAMDKRVSQVAAAVARALQFDQQQPVSPPALAFGFPWPPPALPVLPAEWQEIQQIRRGKRAAERRAARLQREGVGRTRPAALHGQASVTTAALVNTEPKSSSPVLAVAGRHRVRGPQRKERHDWKAAAYSEYTALRAPRYPEALTSVECRKLYKWIPKRIRRKCRGESALRNYCSHRFNHERRREAGTPPVANPHRPAGASD